MGSEQARVFVGRGHEMARADLFLDRVADGVGGLMLCVGEPGVGKTAWGVQVCQRAARRDFLVLPGRALAAEAPIPYGAVASALAPHLRRQPAAELGRLVGDLPSLGAVFEGIGLPVPPLDDAGLLRTRLAVATLTLLGRLAAERPALVWVDDLHWLDPASASLMARLVAELADLPVALLATTRPDRGSLPRPARMLARALPPGHQADVVELGRLTETEVGELASLVAGVQPTRELVGLLWARSRGVALFARELLSDAMRRGLVTAQLDGASLGAAWAVGLPESISDLLQERLDGLTAEAWHVTGLVALAGGELDFDVLQAADGADPDALWQVSRELVRAGVAQERSEPGGAGAFLSLTHPLIGEVVTGRLAPAARQRLHWQLGAALRQVGRPASVLALHYAHADIARGGDDVLEILAAGSRELLARGAFVEAAGCLEAALGRLPAEGSDKRRAELVEDLGTAWFGLAEPTAAAEFWHQALGLLTDAHSVVRLRMMVADAMFFAGRPADSVAHARLAVGSAGEDGALATRARLGLLRSAQRAADIDAARAVAGPLAGLSGGDSFELAVSDTARSSLAMADRDPFSAYRIATGAIARLGSDRDDRETAGVARDLENLALWAAMWLGDLSAMRRHAEASLSLSAGRAHPGFRWRGLVGRFVATLLAGAWDEASDVLVELDALTAEPVPGLMRFIPLCHASLDLPRGELEACRRLTGELERAMARATDPDPEAAATLGAVCALVCLHDGEPAAAWARCAAWAGTRCPVGLPPWADLAAAEAALAAGQYDKARRVAATLDGAAPAGSYVAAMARSVRARARPGRADARELLRAAEELAALGMPHEAARCRYLSAEPDQVRAALRTFERVGASADAERARASIAPSGLLGGVAAGTVTVHREGLAPLPLTPRETEVATLVSQGLTSAAIAETLFVSLRTVTSHLEHIYTKLGVGSRAALTRLVVEQRASGPDR